MMIDMSQSKSIRMRVPVLEVIFYIYDRPLTGINVVAGFCAYNLQIKCVIFVVLKQWLLQQRETEASFVCIILFYFRCAYVRICHDYAEEITRIG